MATANKDLSFFDRTKLPYTKELRFGIVVSEWNPEITENLFQGAYDTLLECGVPASHILRWNVPGSFELPYGCRKMADNQPVDAVIAIGSVIQGETKHFDFVCQATSSGIMQLNLQLNIPVIFCVLTDNTMEQARDRSGGRHGNKGVEAAIAAIQMTALGTSGN